MGALKGAGGDLNILVIDNDIIAAEELKASLKQVLPHSEISIFCDPLLAVKYAYNASKDITLVFCAILMKRADGFRVAGLIRKIYPTVFLVFITLTDSWELATLAKEYGGQVCLSKPITTEQVKETITFLFEQ